MGSSILGSILEPVNILLENKQLWEKSELLDIWNLRKKYWIQNLKILRNEETTIKFCVNTLGQIEEMHLQMGKWAGSPKDDIFACQQ